MSPGADGDRPPRIAVVGAGSASPAEEEDAGAVGAALARSGAVLVCGGLGGVMEAAARGAREAGGTTVGILPGSDPAAANPWIAIPVPTGMGEARNALVVRAAAAVVAVGGAWGTLSEIALARTMGIPVTTLGDAPLRHPELHRAESPEAAVRWALERAGAGA